MGNTVSQGAISESRAAEFLQRKGYKVLFRNYRVKGGEIDIIARDKKFIVFVEVKMRSFTSRISPKEYVDLRKRRKIIHASKVFLNKSCYDRCVRYDVVSIIEGAHFRTYELIKGAFTAESLG